MRLVMTLRRKRQAGFSLDDEDDDDEMRMKRD